MATAKRPMVNPDVDDIADWSKWGYATGTRLISAAQQRLAKLAGTGRLDPDEAMFLQEGLAGIYDALYMGTVSAVRGQENAWRTTTPIATDVKSPSRPGTNPSTSR